MNYLFVIKCKDGGFGWGSTGQIGYTIVQGNDKNQAEKFVKSIIPKGWIYCYVCMTDKSASLDSNIFREDVNFEEI